MATTGKASFSVNDLSMDWDELPRRVEKNCVQCGKPTRGRMRNSGGIVKPAHMSCAVTYVIDKALKIYTPRPENA